MSPQLAGTPAASSPRRHRTPRRAARARAAPVSAAGCPPCTLSTRRRHLQPVQRLQQPGEMVGVRMRDDHHIQLAHPQGAQLAGQVAVLRDHRRTAAHGAPGSAPARRCPGPRRAPASPRCPATTRPPTSSLQRLQTVRPSRVDRAAQAPVPHTTSAAPDATARRRRRGLCITQPPQASAGRTAAAGRTAP